MYWRRLIPARRHPPTEGYNLLSFTSLTWKGASTPCSCLPVSPGRELLPPDNFYWQKASTFILKASTLRSTADHVSSIFKLDPIAPTQPFTLQQTYFAQSYKQNSEPTVTKISDLTQTSKQTFRNTFNFETPLIQISYALLVYQTHICTCVS